METGEPKMSNSGKELDEYPFVILGIQEQLFALSSRKVKAMVRIPEVYDLPDKPEWVRGVINLRGEVINLVDLRVRLGIRSYLDEIDELIDMMEQREQEHRDWLYELERSIQENTEFKLATDPHKCNFGKWYDHYEAQNLEMRNFLRSFDAPHKKIHHIAQEAIALNDSGEQKAALSLIETTREGALSRMIELFSKFKLMIHDLKNLEIAVVFESNGVNTAIAVDSIESVELLEEGPMDKIPEIYSKYRSKLVPYVGKRREDGELVLILDDRHLVLDDE